MRLSTIFALVGLAVLTPITVMAMIDVGYVGIFTSIGESWASAQVGVDLVLSCAIAVVYVGKDVKRRGLPAWPLYVATLFLGSLALLAWMVVRSLLPEPDAIRLGSGRGDSDDSADHQRAGA